MFRLMRRFSDLPVNQFRTEIKTAPTIVNLLRTLNSPDIGLNDLAFGFKEFSERVRLLKIDRSVLRDPLYNTAFLKIV